MPKEAIKSLLRPIVHGLRRQRREKELRRSTVVVSRERLASDLRRLGLEAGDCVLLHSSLKSLGYVEDGPKGLFAAFQDVLGSGGTLVVPTYGGEGTMLETCRDANYRFDARSTPTQLGSIPATFLTLPGIRRSVHPTHSISALGAEAESITGGHHLSPSTYGPDSPWDRLLKRDGKVIGLGVTIWPVALSHVLEDEEGDQFPLPVKMDEHFELDCVDMEGRTVTVPVTPLDPAVAANRIDKRHRQDLRDYYWRDFVTAGAVRVGQVGEAESWIASARVFYARLRSLMKDDVTIYATPEQMAARPLPSPAATDGED